MVIVLIGMRVSAQAFTPESLEFQRRISQRNGLGEETYLPPALHMDPPVVNMENAREEARMVLFGAVQEVFDRTGVQRPHPPARVCVSRYAPQAVVNFLDGLCTALATHLSAL